jgi:hypothetical protein
MKEVPSVTTWLDLLGSLLLVLAVGVLIAEWTIPGALAAAGALLIVLSWLIDRRQRVDGRETK